MHTKHDRVLFLLQRLALKDSTQPLQTHWCPHGALITKLSAPLLLLLIQVAVVAKAGPHSARSAQAVVRRTKSGGDGSGERRKRVMAAESKKEKERELP